ESSPIPEECSHWKATRSIPCKVCGKLTFSTSGRCLSHIRRRYDKLRSMVREKKYEEIMDAYRDTLAC
ncbi:9541_t:CDS:1, partial [Entrophospora sp. SA101]